MGILRRFKKYNNYASASDYISSVADSDLVCYMRADLYDSLIPVLSELTMDKSKVSALIDKFKPIYSWSGTENDVEDIKVNGTAVDPDSDDETVTVRNIDFIIMDKRLVACTCDNKKVTSQYNPAEDTTNYFHNAVMKYRVNSELPIIVECDCDSISDAIVIEAID